MIDVNDVADYFIHTANDVGDCITNLKLQKLAYYSEAWYLALFDNPLTGARFEAWVHGPVCPALYRRFSGNGSTPIPDVDAPALEAGVEAHLNEVLDVYSQFSAWDLERMTHAEEPWLSARGDLAPDVGCNRKIDPALMKEFYQKRLTE